MAKRTILKSRPRPRLAPPWVSRHQAPVVRAITATILLLLSVFFSWGVRQWYLWSTVSTRTECLLPVKERFSGTFEAHWFSCSTVPAFVRGDEAAVQEFLRMEPSLEALVSRKDGSVWVRGPKGMALQPDGPRSGFYRELATRLNRTGSDFHCPEEGKDPDFGWILRVAVSAEDWVAIKGLEPGGAALEMELAQVLGPNPDLRINLQHLQPDPRPGSQPQAYPATPYQLPERAAAAERWTIAYWNRHQTPGWLWISVPSGALRRAMYATFCKKLALLLVPVLVLACLAAFVIRVRRNTARQAELAKDRLASLTHSLKTPLAVIKAWCDASRHGRLDKDQTDLLMIRIGEQVDQLTIMIQSGLRTLHPGSSPTPGEPVTLVWLKGISEGFQDLCDESGRRLAAILEGEGCCADRTSLAQVLQTLLENALLHGRGTITFSSIRKGNRLLLSVGDEGPGLDAAQLERLGLPFLRFRQPGSEGYDVPGMGLGLSLAIQIAEKEGWGLRFRSEPDAGLLVTVEIRD